MIELNEVFLERMKSILGEKYDDFLQSLEKPSQKAIYVNENKISIDDFLKIVDFKVEQIPYEKCGFYVDNIKLGRHPLHHAGAFYLQEPSAMFTVNALKFKGNEKVLDMCASPGGKTIQIANRIPNGVLVSNEFVKARSEILFSNVERMGLKNVIITNETPENLAKAYGNVFDICLVDAPCSGEGMFRKGEDMISSWNVGLNLKCQARQLEILEQANKTLKQGGYLIYSTCTYSIEENEEVVRNFLLNHDYDLVNIDYPYSRGINMPEAVRLYPHDNKGEGQFVAVLKKKEECDNFGSILKLKTNNEAKKFLNENVDINSECYNFGDYAYLVKDLNFVRKNVNYVSLGVRVGENLNNRFAPYHFIFSALGKDFKHIINCEIGNINTAKYLKGETLECNIDNGYGCFMIENIPLGGFKISNEKFKNLYPKGLRNFK